LIQTPRFQIPAGLIELRPRKWDQCCLCRDAFLGDPGEFERNKPRRRDDWSEIAILVPDDSGKDGALRREDGKIQNYRIGTREEGKATGSALLDMRFVYPIPSRWFPQLKYRSKQKTFYNGTGVGHVRKKEWLRGDRFQTTNFLE
jgi:hypothetical protein